MATLREQMQEELFPKSHLKDGNRTEFFDPLTVKKALNQEASDLLAAEGMAGLAGGRTKLIPSRRGCDCNCECDCC